MSKGIKIVILIIILIILAIGSYFYSKAVHEQTPDQSYNEEDFTT